MGSGGLSLRVRMTRSMRGMRGWWRTLARRFARRGAMRAGGGGVSRRADLLDEVVHPAVLDQAARAWARKPKRPLDRPVQLGLTMHVVADVAELVPAGRQFIYRRARNAVLARTHGQYPAPLRALEAI